MQPKDFYSGVFLGAVLGAGIAVAVSLRITQSMIDDAIAAIPPSQRVAVIDLLGSAKAVVEWPEQDQQRVLKDLQSNAARLAQEGVIVLTSDAVFNAPQEAFVRIPKPAAHD